ncbi:uncharacterized protein Dwil_GK12661 [Drosophila willistoni]|uniref:Folded gastrulation N-terminal domain-containing protein n=2 Tax=Drosophila willistoni TaxID=7260 RepID=B4N396_DROWI|nr:uncharacterized protein Dwil_GK12661 [Drosophila willistoni]
MKCLLVFTLILATSLAVPLQLIQLGDLFAGVEQQQQARQQDVVKRQVQANADGQLKQISFHGLIGDLENSLFESALSLHGASAPDSEISEIKPGQADEGDSEHAITKRSDESTVTTDSPSSSPVSTSSSAEDAQTRKILLQTTRKVPSNDDVPAHLIIDHVSVQPHNGGSVPLIPTFQVHRTKVISIKEDVSSDDSTDGKQTKISITKTSITSTAPLEPSADTQSTSSTQTEEVNSSSSTSTSSSPSSTTTATTEVSSSSSDSSSSSSSTTTTTTSSTTTTTEQPLEKLKKDEEKLKEKVAEVEADPVILTTRV